MGHSSVERRLRADIEKRHRLKDELERKQSLTVKLAKKLEITKKKRLNNRYSATIERLDVETETLREKLNEVNIDLQKRIKDEMEFSEEEVSELRKRYQKEYAGMVEAESRLEAIQEGTVETDVEETSEEEEPVSKEAVTARTRRALKKERRAVEEIQKEISSEERDKILFTRELQQIMAELEDYTD